VRGVAIFAKTVARSNFSSSAHSCKREENLLRRVFALPMLLTSLLLKEKSQGYSETLEKEADRTVELGDFDFSVNKASFASDDGTEDVRFSLALVKLPLRFRFRVEKFFACGSEERHRIFGRCKESITGVETSEKLLCLTIDPFLGELTSTVATCFEMLNVGAASLGT